MTVAIKSIQINHHQLEDITMLKSFSKSTKKYILFLHIIDDFIILWTS